MADRTQLRVAEQDQLSSEDPFAELTRIMGFDPRGTARQQSEAVSAPESAHESFDAIGGDDFGIDLERELMGEFGLADDGQGSGHAFQPAEPQYSHSHPVADEQGDAFAHEAGTYEAEAVYAAQEPYAEPTMTYDEPEVVAQYDAAPAYQEFEAAPAYDYAPEAPVDQAADAFDEAFAASVEQELSLDGDWQAEAVHDRDEVSTHDVAASSYYEPSLEPAYQQPVAYDHVEVVAEASYAEEAVAASFEDEFALDADWQQAEEQPFSIEEPEVAPTYEPVAYQQGLSEQGSEFASSPVGEVDFSDEFDTALAEVDMDFTAVPLASAGGAAFEPQVDFDAQETSYFHAEEPHHIDAPAAPEVTGPSLEDELNALLGNMSEPQQAFASAPAAHVEYVPEIETLAAFDEPEFAAAEEFELGLDDEDFHVETPAAPVSEPVFTQARSEHSYSRGNYRIGQPAYVQPVAESYSPAPVAYVEAPVEPIAYMPENAHEPEFELEPELELDFDDDAFEAAFAGSIEDVQPAAHAAEPATLQPEVAQESDPYAELAALTASFKPTVSTATAWNQYAPSAAEPQQADMQGFQEQDDQDDYAASAYEDFPDIDTVDVPEQAVALADDLELPELSFEEDVPVVPAYDDLDAEFANLLNEMNSPEPATPEPATPTASEADDFAAEFEREFQFENQAYQASDYAAAAGIAAAGALGAAALASAKGGYGSDDFADSQTSGRGQFATDAFDYDPDLEDDMAASAYAAKERQAPQRRGAIIAAVIGGVVVLGGIGAYALSGGGGSSTPAVIKADEGPIKMRPENPGGSTVPNQDSKVYETVARTPSNEPTQKQLVTTAETPIDMTAQDEAPLDEEEVIVGDEENAAPAGKSEDRIMQAIQEDSGAAQNAEVAAVAPRKVRTMIVKADGTLVPREDPAPEPAAAPEEAAAPAASAPAASAPAQQAPAEAAAPASKPQSSNTPATVAVAPSRPSDQPVNVVGEVKPDQVALNAASAGEWAMQIASQPTEAAAQASYQDLLRKYGGVLNGHPANVVKAEIAGKGTFYRVRVPAATRNDAIALCESYKAAGGNCFVSK
ncbi:SPOR domain-containing protein [Mesorhizobium sp. KR1-2]|uniref:SPOR domain-containing protein n=1 Tax=Mesorhizobium sp. KR1-2 TaxID=3156609 RepID=UPI0032B32E1F